MDFSSRRCKGSPPLTRGKVSETNCFCISKRITPAYAGKSDRPGDLRGRVEDHPRLRGEKCQAINPKNSVEGSPPLTRGKVSSMANSSAVARITPAYAGKSQASKQQLSVNRGSPPLTRGKAIIMLGSSLLAGITPAYAGKREGEGGYSSGGEDHPRLRGEKPIEALQFHRDAGSPPLTRGKDGVETSARV
mgnify:CR=1 FL=1